MMEQERWLRHLVADRDALSARGFGGTADVVVHVRERETRVLVLWPPGSRRG
ncbi:hypothetical protein AAH991_03015 [Microbispora sp. ZYX-F-249]|uniref:Uncharacterized protein n=1 Tax=Microbispora maris TaxID=3144104 RepID=A0ABV0AJY1_9ACTN